MTATVSRHRHAVYGFHGLAWGRGVEAGFRQLGLSEVLATPVVALVLGLIVGAGLLSPLAFGYRFFREQTDIGMAIVMGSVLGGLLLAVGVLFLYRALSPEGVIWFGPSLVGGFVAALAAFAVSLAKSMLKSNDDTRR